MKKGESGITLISLVITIIVIFILTGISISMSVGENGIIGQTSNVVNQYTNVSEKEQEETVDFTSEFNLIINDDNLGEDSENNVVVNEKPSINITGWNTTGGIVELSEQSGYTTQYKIGITTQWRDYTGQVNIDNGETIYARYFSDSGVSQIVSKEIEDTNGPELTITSLTTNEGKITITVKARDNEMGMPTQTIYNYYIKPHSEKYYKFDGQNTTGSYSFLSLKENTSYDIIVSTMDISGNKGSVTTNIQT